VFTIMQLENSGIWQSAAGQFRASHRLAGVG
jgi:hypothetical protein